MNDLEVGAAMNPAREMGPTLPEVTESSYPIVLSDDCIEHPHSQLRAGTNAGGTTL